MTGFALSLRGFVLAACAAASFSVLPSAGAEAAAVYCTRPGYPVGCVGGVGAPGVGVVGAPAARAVARPGPGVNGGGPVNRPGLR